MEPPDNCQCYCYAIMSSLCFPCQVKIHLLHLTASPHGELIKNVRCQSPKDKTRFSPDSAGQERSHTPTSYDRENRASPDCDKCDYYMNFINKLTSGLCEEKIMRLVCSNPCLISTDTPSPPVDAIKNQLPTPKNSIRHSNAEPSVKGDSLARPTRSGTNAPLAQTVDSPNTLKPNIPSKWSTKSNSAKGPNAKEQQLARPINNKVPTTTTNASLKLEKNSNKKPTTPTELMTTDKILRRSFESIAKNRQSPIASRTPSPNKKNPPVIKPATVNLIKIVATPTNNGIAPKSNNKQTKTEQKSSEPQASSPNSSPKKWLRNENNQRQPIGKEIPIRNSKGQGNPVSGKPKTKDVSQTRVLLPYPNVNSKKSPKSLEPVTNSPVKCDEEVCEFHPGMRPGAVWLKEGEVKNEQGNEHSKGVEKLDGSAPKNGFFEAALVMEFYQPPQLGSKNTSTNPVKRLVHEYENEPSDPNLGEGVLKQFCGKPKRGHGTKEDVQCADNTVDSSNPSHSRELTPNTNAPEEGSLPTIPQQSVEALPIVKNNKMSKKKNTGISQREKVEDERWSALKQTELPKQKKRHCKRDAPMSDEQLETETHQVTVEQVKYFTNDNTKCNKPVWDDMQIQGEKSMWDECENDQQSVELTNLEKARERFKGTECSLTNSGPRRASRDVPTPAAYHDDMNSVKTAADSTPTKNAKEGNSDSGCRNIQRDAGEYTQEPNYTSEGIFYVNNSNKYKESNENPSRRYSKEMRGVCDTAEDLNPFHGINTSQGVKENRRYSKSKGKGRDFAQHTQSKKDSPSQHEINTNNVKKTNNGLTKYECFEVDNYLTEMDVTSLKKRYSVEGKGKHGGVVKRRDEDVEREPRCNYRENSAGFDHEYKAVPKADDHTRLKQTSNQIKSGCDEGIVRKSMSDSRSSCSDDKSPRSPSHKKSKSPNRHRGSGTYGDDATRVYPQFSEYMNPDNEGYKSKSTGNVADDHNLDILDFVRPNPDAARPGADVPPPRKYCSDRGSSSWNCGVCPDDDKRVYYHTNSDGKCTSMVIGLPQDSRSSNPHIRINFNKQVKKEMTCYKVDKSEQKNDYRDTGTQYDGPDLVEETSPNPSPPATAKTSKNRFPPKTTAKPTQSSGQMYYNRPLMRRSFL